MPTSRTKPGQTTVTPTPLEVSRVPTVDNNPSELERHVFVMRDGTMVFGKVYKFRVADVREALGGRTLSTRWA